MKCTNIYEVRLKTEQEAPEQKSQKLCGNNARSNLEVRSVQQEK